MKTTHWVLYDEGDGTYHTGGGNWDADPEAAERYGTEDDGLAALEECDGDHVFRDRFRVKPVEGGVADARP